MATPDPVQLTSGIIGGHRWPWSPDETWWAVSPATLDAGGEKHALVFSAPKTGTLRSAYWALGTVTTPPTNGMMAQFRGVAYSSSSAERGVPVATVDQYRHIPSSSFASNNWLYSASLTNNGTTGGTLRSVTRGDRIALVLSYTTNYIDGNVQFGYLNVPSDDAPGHFVRDLNAGVWSDVQGYSPLVVLEYSDGTKHKTHMYKSFSGRAPVGVNFGAAYKAAGLSFTPPFGGHIDAVDLMVTGNPTSSITLDLVVEDVTAGSVLNATQIDMRQWAMNANLQQLTIPLASTGATLTAGNSYRVWGQFSGVGWQLYEYRLSNSLGTSPGKQVEFGTTTINEIRAESATSNIPTAAISSSATWTTYSSSVIIMNLHFTSLQAAETSSVATREQPFHQVGPRYSSRSRRFI